MPTSARPITVTRHEQTEPAMVWRVVHGQGSHPAVDVYIEYGAGVQRVVPRAVTYVDSNTVDITFSHPQSGYATVVV